MFGLLAFRISTDKIFTLLEDFEQFCLGRKQMTPRQFTHLNEELSISAVLKIGKSRMQFQEDGNHVIWTAPDKNEYDLGAVEKLNVRDYPGFHRSRSLSLGQEHVAANELVHVPAINKHITMVRMKDGSTGYGPNYRLALRNAALKMHLKKEFNKANPPGLWKMFYGNA